MSELRLNKSAVTHISIRDKREGPRYYGAKYTWLEAKPKKWFFNTYHPAGFYRHGKYDGGFGGSIYSRYFTLEEVVEEKAWSIEENEEGKESIYTKPQVVLYIGKNALPTIYFNTLKECREHCIKAFPHINYIIQE